MDASLLEKPIVIVGPPRSGTSLLMNVLGEHRDLAEINEPRLIWRYGNDGLSDVLRASHATPAVREHVRAAFAERIRQQGASRMVEKTPSNALRPAFVNAIFPDCLFISILRHPYDTILSIRAAWDKAADGLTGMRARRWKNRMRELDVRRAPRYALELVRRALPRSLTPIGGRPEWGPRLPGMQGLLRELSPLEIACLQWRASVEISLPYCRDLPEARYLELRLEDLTHETMQQTLSFCGLDDDQAVWARFDAEVDRARAGRHRGSASPEDLETIRAFVGQTPRWLGYEL